MSRCASAFSLAASLMICLLACSAARADFTSEIFNYGDNKYSWYEPAPPVGTPSPKTLTIKVTDKDHNVIDAIGYPKNATATPSSGPNGQTNYSANFKLEKNVAPNNGVPGATAPVIDFRMIFPVGNIASAPFKMVAADFESIQHNAVDGYYIDSVYGQITAVVGLNVDVSVPLVVSLDDADFYELVDMNVFLYASPPNVNLFDTLAITDGQSEALPGMYFSSTPFDFDSVNGLSYTPYNGDVEVVGSDTLTAVPEPSGIVLAALGFSTLITLGWRRRKR